MLNYGVLEWFYGNSSHYQLDIPNSFSPLWVVSPENSIRIWEVRQLEPRVLEAFAFTEGLEISPRLYGTSIPTFFMYSCVKNFDIEKSDIIV